MANKLQTFKIKEWVALGQTFFKPPFKITDTLINEARIVYVVNGHSKLYSANQYTELQSGDLLIMKTDNFINNWFENEDDTLTQVVVFQLTSELLHFLYDNHLPDWFAQKETKLENSVEKVPSSILIKSYFESFANYLENPELFNEELIKIKIKELISLMVQADQSGGVKKIFGNLFNSSEFQFQEVVQNNLFEDLNLEDLAFFAGLSLSSFKRKFTTIYGTSPNKYITSKRLEKAQELIQYSKFTISEIAYECGFSDVGYFSKTFKRYYNFSPSDLRK